MLHLILFGYVFRYLPPLPDELTKSVNMWFGRFALILFPAFGFFCLFLLILFLVQ